MTRKTTDNPVLKAMIGIEELLDPLTDQGKAQVLRWANDEYGHVLAAAPVARMAGQADKQLGQQDGRPVEVVHP
jgi:hypothetical protein